MFTSSSIVFSSENSRLAKIIIIHRRMKKKKKKNVCVKMHVVKCKSPVSSSECKRNFNSIVASIFRVIGNIAYRLHGLISREKNCVLRLIEIGLIINWIY